MSEIAIYQQFIVKCELSFLRKRNQSLNRRYGRGCIKDFGGRLDQLILIICDSLGHPVRDNFDRVH